MPDFGISMVEKQLRLCKKPLQRCALKTFWVKAATQGWHLKLGV